MIDLGKPPLHAPGVTLFPDHAAPDRFYYLADCPRLRRTPEGLPELKLLKYRLDASLRQALGAGLLSLTVDLGVEEERLKTVRRRLAAHTTLTATPQLVPFPAEAGKCELVLIDRSSAADGGATAMVERILGAAAPALYGDNAATFLAVLSAEGAALIEGALSAGGLPLGVVYTLQTSGLRPALRATITARWRDIYHFYENRLHGGRLLLATDIGATVEQLRRDELIRVEIDELVPEPEVAETHKRALDQVERYILEEFFRPTLGQQPPPAEAADGPLATIGNVVKDIFGFFSVTYSLREVDRTELKTLTYNLRVARAERITLAPQGTFSVLLDRVTPLSRLITEVEPAAQVEMQFDIGAAIDLAAEELDRLEVFLEYGERKETLVLDAAAPRKTVSFFFKRELGPEIAYRYEADFRAGGAGLTGKVASPAVRTAGRVIRLNPRELYQRAALTVLLRGVPLDRYPAVLVDLRADEPLDGWRAAATLTLDAAHLEQSFAVRARRDAEVRFERRIRYVAPNGSETVLDWDDVEPGVLVVGDPLPGVIDVTILGSARFDTVVKRLVVELRPVAATGQTATRILTGEQPAATWSWRVPEGASRAYQYRVTVHTALNEVNTGEWLPGPEGKLIVGEGFARLRPVRMKLIGRPLAQQGILAVKVRYEFQDPEARLQAETEMLVEDISKFIEWSYPVADVSRQHYTYQLTLILEDGTMKVLDPVRTADQLVVRPLVR